MLDPDYPTPDDIREERFHCLRNGALFSVPLWALLGIMLWSCGAFAQNVTSGSQSGSNANAGSRSSIRQTIVIPNGNGNSAGGQSVDARTAGDIARAQGYRGQAGLTRNEQGVEYSGGTNSYNRTEIVGGSNDRLRSTIRNTPDAFGPNVSGGTNPCTGAVSGGLALPGFGASIGAAWSEEGCERRQLAALLHNTGQPELAQELLCNSPEVRQTRARMGRPCIVDQPQQANAQGPVQMMVPAGQVVTPVQARTIPDWCYSATAAERRRYPAGTCE